MDPDLAITICFVGLVFVFALAFAVYAVREAGRIHAESLTDPARRNRPRESS
jgi:hypothetical protein